MFNLELTRLYGYLYQKTDKNFTIIHALDGYDEVSLTSDFKYVNRQSEAVLSPESLGFSTLTQESLAGGDTVASSADLFINILENRGTGPQNDVVIANSGLAIATAQNISFSEGIEKAKESLKSGKALKSFKKFIEINQ